MAETGNEHDPLEIPPHARPVEYVLAQHEGREYVSFATIEEARRHPHGVMIMEADFGGQILLTCPAAQVKADAAALKRLLTDLEWICWGPGFQVGDPGEPDGAAIYFEALPPGSGVGGGMGGGFVTDGLWLHDELEELRLGEQISEILDGSRARLELPTLFPDDETLTSLEEARRYPRAWLRMQSGLLPKAVLLDAAVSIIRALEGALVQLLVDLEARVAEHGQLAPPGEQRPARLYFRRRVRLLRPMDLDLGHWGDPVRVRAVLTGELDRI